MKEAAMQKEEEKAWKKNIYEDTQEGSWKSPEENLSVKKKTCLSILNTTFLSLVL